MVSTQTRKYLDRIRQSHRLLNDAELTEILKRKHWELAKELYRERSKEAYNQAQETDSKRIKWALNGGSTKRLVNNGVNPIGLPVMVSDPDNPDQILSNPEEVKRHQQLTFPNCILAKLHRLPQNLG